MSAEEFDATFGRTSREIIRELWRDLPLGDDEVSALDDRKEAFFREILRADFPAMPGARELIDQLKESGFRLAVGSSGPPENIGLVLDALGCRDRFDAIVTGVDVRRGKPDPEVFLLCAERLGARPTDCAVIEDAVVGIEAARRAGMVGVALVVDPRDAGPFNHAHQVVRDLSELSPAGIGRWITDHGLGAGSPGGGSQ
jgi:beta-phosphoglucomutase